MTGFRNILVHEYLEIDLDIVYEILQNNLDDLKSILKEYAKLL
ncbi:MAG: HepT-like ribonuclease domain-containing protein [Halanaerobiales bacterium]